MTPRVQRIAQYLKEHGQANTAQIAQALGETTDSVASAIQHERNRIRWGIVKLGRDPNSVKRSVLLWGIDTTPVRKPPRKRTIIVRDHPPTPGLVLIPDSPYKTKWQPSAPYGSHA